MDAKAINLQTLDLKDLRFGHELSKGGINDRVTGRDSMIEELAANIEAVGLLQPLVAWGNGNAKGQPPYYVLAGNRRLAALRLLQKKLGGSQAIVILLDAMDVNEALNLAASSNLHAPVHPIDRYETFARLVAGGMVPKAIAQTYGLELKEVDQSLALGRLAPEIRTAWRDRKVSAEIAQAFTLEPDPKRQADIYAKLKKAHALHGQHSVRAAIMGDATKLAAMLKYVTPMAYAAAGGEIRVDLFAQEGETSYAQNGPMLRGLADAKLDAECAKLTKAGWKWAMRKDETPPNAEYIWAKTGNGPKSSAADKAKSGCIVGLDYDGKLQIHYGLLKPGDAKAVKAGKEPAAAKPKKAKADPKALSGALAARLDTQVAFAVQDMLRGWSAAVDSFGDVACHMMADMIAPERLSWSSVKIDDVRRLRDAAPAKEATAVLCKRFDAKDYFASIPTALIKKLLETELHTSPADGGKGIAKMGKTQLADVAVKCAEKSGWLPIQMRQSAAKPAKKARRK